MIFFWPLILLLLTITSAHAYTTQTPEISGFNSRTMKLTGGSGGFSGGNYSRTGTVVINGKTVPIPGSLKPSSTMGSIVKNALKLNPYKIAGTLAAGWLISKGIEWLEDQKAWQMPKSGTVLWTGYLNCGPLPEADFTACVTTKSPGYTWTVRFCPGAPEGSTCGQLLRNGSLWQSISHTNPSSTVQPMTDADWDALSDPMPTVGAELPTAQYLPEGVTIVEPPAYIPQTVSVGAPYTKADGSTAQPMAKITPAGDGQVTIDLYEKPLTNPDGTPVPADTPNTDTKEDPPPPKDPCVENPDRIGCMVAGSDTFATPKKDIAFTFTPEASPLGAGFCPAPISVMGQQISYQPACNAMGMIKALVIAMASLMAAYILVGAFKGGD